MYVELSQKLFKYLPLDNVLLRSLRFLDPAFWSKRAFVNYVLTVAKVMPTVLTKESLNELEVEARRFPLLLDLHKHLEASSDIETIWVNIAESNECPLLSKVALAGLSIFHGNADVERANSLIGNQQLKDKRNRLSVHTLEALIRIKIYLQVHYYFVLIIKIPILLYIYYVKFYLF